MPQGQLFRLGADVHCTDGDCGKVRSLVVKRGGDEVTHLVVEPAHRHALGMLVPLGLVDDTAKGEVRLRCTMAEFGRLDPAEAEYFVPDNEHYNTSRELVFSWPYYAPPGALSPGAPGRPGDPDRVAQPVILDTVPDQLPGEDEVSRGEQVHATDGDIGHVRGIVVEAATGRVTSVLLREGHVLSHRTVLIPRSAVAEVGEDGFHLNITKEQVQNLPSADVERPVG
jgi:PRC-barrel domain